MSELDHPGISSGSTVTSAVVDSTKELLERGHEGVPFMVAALGNPDLDDGPALATRALRLERRDRMLRIELTHGLVDALLGRETLGDAHGYRCVAPPAMTGDD
jgi:hypothetical protein